jgi:hypothetical protein
VAILDSNRKTCYPLSMRQFKVTIYRADPRRGGGPSGDWILAVPSQSAAAAIAVKRLGASPWVQSHVTDAPAC